MKARSSKQTPEQIEQAKAKRREYDRKWRQNNPDKVKEIQLRYWLKKAGVTVSEK